MKKIACIGNITYDILAYTNDYPKENFRTNYDELIMGYGGPAANAATVISKFGNSVDFYGVLGNDNFSSLITNELNNTNITNKTIIKENFIPPLSYIIISKNNKTRTINSYRHTNDNNIKFNNFESNYDYILTDGKYYDATLELFKKNKNAIKIIDAGRCNDNVISLCKLCDYVICSEDFANDFMKKLNLDSKINFNNPISIKVVMYTLQKYFNESKVVITVGDKGYLYIDNNNNIIHNYPIKIDKVKDTNAAGDIFHGAFTYAIANNYNFKNALKFANITSTLSVKKQGGKISCPNLEEVKKLKKVRS